MSMHIVDIYYDKDGINIPDLQLYDYDDETVDEIYDIVESNNLLNTYLKVCRLESDAGVVGYAKLHEPDEIELMNISPVSNIHMSLYDE